MKIDLGICIITPSIKIERRIFEFELDRIEN